MKANFVQTLMYYDGPQVVLLTIGKKGSTMVAVAIQKDGMEYPFFGCAVKKRDWERYLEGKVDLFYLFANATVGHKYFFDLDKLGDDGVVTLKKATDAELEVPDIWPDRGFFATYHTEPLADLPNVENDIQVFNIDGTWEAVDFSGFYGKLSDIYAIFYLREMFEGGHASAAVLDKAKAAVRARLWQAGGSYKGFYGALGDGVPSMSRLRVSRIQYASPGKIELRGREDLFEDMLTSLDHLKAGLGEAKEAYRYIDQVLAHESLKKAGPNSTFSAEGLKNSVKEKSLFLLKQMGIRKPETFFDVCDQNVLVFAKLTLSVYRRFKGIYDFVAEGRIAAEQRLDVVDVLA